MSTVFKRLKRSDQSGAVAMLSVTIFSIIITIVATSYIKTVISQQKSAIDYDRGTQAYYAAESGVQDGARAIQASPTIRANGKDTCKPANPNPDGKLGPTGYDLSYTCQLIDVTPSAIEGSVQPGQRNAVIKIEPSDTSFNSGFQIVFRWSQKTDESIRLYPRSSTLPFFPATGKWNALNYTDNPIHAMLRVNVISHPKSNFSSDEISQRVMFLNPTGTTGASPTININDGVYVQERDLFNNAFCVESDGTNLQEFSCRRTIKFTGYDLTGRDFYLNVGSVYKSTNVAIEMYTLGSPPAPIQLANTQASIDVTGKSGDTTFRRVKQTLPLGGYAEKEGPDAALVVGEGICKHFSVGTTPQIYNSYCNPLN